MTAHDNLREAAKRTQSMKTRQEVETVVAGIAADLVCVETAYVLEHRGADFYASGLVDSLDFIEVLMAIEDDLNIVIEDEKADHVRTFDQLLTVVYETMGI